MGVVRLISVVLTIALMSLAGEMGILQHWSDRPSTWSSTALNDSATLKTTLKQTGGQNTLVDW